MMGHRAAVETAIGMAERGEIAHEDRNAWAIRMEGARLVRGRLSADIRKQLRDAVKRGLLGHLPKEGMRPEAFYHPNARSVAMERRDAEFRMGVEALRRVCG